MKEIQAVIFDMDGVLLDTEPIYTQVTQAVLDEFGKRFEWSLKSKMVGRTNMEAAAILINELELNLTPEAFLEKQDVYFEELFPKCQPMPGVIELIKALSKADIPMAVGTSSSTRFFNIKTQFHQEWFQLFSTVVRGDDPEVKAGKPAPDIFLTAAKRLGVAPENCLVFEDAPTGLKAGKTANMSVIAIPDANMPIEAYDTADLVIDSFHSLKVSDLPLKK